MDFVREHLALKLTAAALAFLATFAVVRALDAAPTLFNSDRPDADLSDGLLPSATTPQRIEALEAQVRQSPSDPKGYTDLGAAYLTRFAETEDPGFYPKAEQVFRTALSLEPKDLSAIAGLAQLQLSRHQFRQGLALAQRARRISPSAARPDALLTDAQVELGRYGAAVRTLQRYVNRRPELGSYARVSYYRELHGDMRGALEAMQLAASSAGENSVDAVYAVTLLGKLRADQAAYAAAERAFRSVLERKPGYPDAMLGLAAIEFGRGNVERSLDLYRQVQRSVPAPDHAILLGDAQEAAGNPEAAGSSYRAARDAFAGLEAQGANTATERTVFEADHGDPDRAVALGRRALHLAPSVRTADALSWALSSAGHDRAALRLSHRAMQLGSLDPVFLYHAGLVSRRAGDLPRARELLGTLLELDPWFSPLHSRRARAALASIR
jgi:tetratricopeptide (TPR) repeat protein